MQLRVENYIIDARDRNEGIFYSDGRGNNIHVAYDEIESPELDTFKGAFVLPFNYIGGRIAFAFTFGDMDESSRQKLLALKVFVDVMTALLKKDHERQEIQADMNKQFSMMRETAKMGKMDIAYFFNMKSKLTAIRRNMTPPSNPDNSIFKDDFYIFDGNSAWNFIDKYKDKDHAWYEFCYTDRKYQVFSKGLTVYATENDVLNAFDAEPEITDFCNFLKDDLYLWSHLENSWSETMTLCVCDRALRYHLNCYEGYDYSLTFYFIKGQLLMVGYTKKKSVGVFDL